MLQIKKEIDETILLEAGEDELAILISTFEVVMNTIRGGFHARIGADREEVQALLLLIQTALRTLKFQDSNSPTTELQISVADLRILTRSSSNSRFRYFFPDRIPQKSNRSKDC
jgi:hypothetical protein